MNQCKRSADTQRSDQGFPRAGKLQAEHTSSTLSAAYLLRNRAKPRCLPCGSLISKSMPPPKQRGIPHQFKSLLTSNPTSLDYTGLRVSSDKF
jgi:hypothetical protein